MSQSLGFHMFEQGIVSETLENVKSILDAIDVIECID